MYIVLDGPEQIFVDLDVWISFSDSIVIISHYRMMVDW